jgi:hypothetical protein
MVLNKHVEEDLDKIEKSLKEDINRLANGRLVQPDYLGDRMGPLKELNEKRQLLETLQWVMKRPEA